MVFSCLSTTKLFFIWNSLRYVDKGNVKALIQAMFTLGLAMIVRPTNVLFGLFLLIYLFESGKSFSKIIEDIKNQLLPHLLALFAFIIPIAIQMGLWKYISGQWIQTHRQTPMCKSYRGPICAQTSFRRNAGARG